MSDATQILQSIEKGDPHAAEALLPLVYEELRKLARAKLAHEKPGQTLQPTSLVHEAYLRLVDVEKAQHWNSRGHFFAAAAEAMRRILINHARDKKCLKRGGAWRRLELDDLASVESASPDELLALDAALEKLAAEDPACADVVKLRFFAGLTMDQSAQMLGISPRTADRHWAYGRAWLYKELRDAQAGRS